jgi:type III pantothenate kinase
MLLAVDVGNSNIVLGLYRGRELVSSWRLHTDAEATADELALQIRSLMAMDGQELACIDGVVIASVVPPLIYPLTRFSERYLHLDPLVVGPGSRTGMPILIDNPKELGADLIVNAVAAQEKYGTPVLIVDFGTATTFSAVSKKGEYVGGAIASGIKMSLQGLFLQTAKLPQVEIVEAARVIGKNTVQSMQAGVFFGFIGLTNEIISRMKEEVGGDPPVIATGGLSVLISRHIPQIDRVDPQLTLDGLRIVFERNLRKV